MIVLVILLGLVSPSLQVDKGVLELLASFRLDVCPTDAEELRYGTHALPKQVFYTGKTDGHLRDLTYEQSEGRWPDDFVFRFYDNDDMDLSMQQLSGMMKSRVPGLYEAFSMLRPWAYRADLWRYCILWACGGVYVDSKLAIAEPFDEFLWHAGFNPEALNTSSAPQLFSCRDDLASMTMHTHYRLHCVWQGLLVAEPGSDALLRTIEFVVKKIQERWYPSMEISKMPWLFLTGPGAMALATQHGNPQWDDHIKLNCRMAYTPHKDENDRGLLNPHLVGDWKAKNASTVYNEDINRASFVADAGLHVQQRTNSYGKLFKAGLVYMDDQWPQPPQHSNHTTHTKSTVTFTVTTTKEKEKTT